VTIPDAVLLQFDPWGWASYFSKHVEDCNNCIKICALSLRLY
jgi:hypothetical protein